MQECKNVTVLYFGNFIHLAAGRSSHSATESSQNFDAQESDGLSSHFRFR